MITNDIVDLVGQQEIGFNDQQTVDLWWTATFIYILRLFILYIIK